MLILIGRGKYVNKPKILIIDDDDFLIETIKSVLEQDYELLSAGTGEGIIDRLDSETPELIILDVNLPLIDGYEVCRTIKDSFDHDTIPVLFLSGINDLEHRIKGYEVGGEDYITKPFDGEELKAKIQTLIRHRQTTEQYKEKANGAMQQAMSVITSTGETAYVIDFLRESYHCDNLHSLADKVVNVCNEYGLNTLVRFSAEDYTIFKGTTGLGSPIEKSLFDHIPPHIHIHTFNKRCIFNYGITGILVKNMPLDDPDKCGRIRDNVAIIAEGANAAVKSILHTNILNNQQNHLKTLMEHDYKHLKLPTKRIVQIT